MPWPRLEPRTFSGPGLADSEPRTCKHEFDLIIHDIYIYIYIYIYINIFTHICTAEPINALESTAPTCFESNNLAFSVQFDSQIEFLPSTETSRSPIFSFSALSAGQGYSAF